jgi:hypothetical protein
MMRWERMALGQEVTWLADLVWAQQSACAGRSVSRKFRLGYAGGITKFERSLTQILPALRLSRPGRCRPELRVQELFCPKDRQANAKHRRDCIPRHITSGPGGPSLRRPM